MLIAKKFMQIFFFIDVEAETRIKPSETKNQILNQSRPRPPVEAISEAPPFPGLGDPRDKKMNFELKNRME